VHGLFIEPIIGHDVNFYAEGGPIWIKVLQTGEEWHDDCGDMVKIQTRCRISMWRTFGRIPWHVIPQSPATLQGAATWRIKCHDSRATCHIAGCWHRRIQRHVIPEPRITLQGAATWWIHCHDSLEPHATLQGAVTWRNQSHDRATLQGVIIPSAILKIVFRLILFIFCFFMQIGLWRAAAFVSSSIHLF